MPRSPAWSAGESSGTIRGDEGGRREEEGGRRKAEGGRRKEEVVNP
jgi:hypothetical protein